MDAIYNFAYTKRNFGELYPLVETLIEKVKSQAHRVIKRNLRDWKLLNTSNLAEFGSTILDQIERLNEFRAFGIPHDELAKTFDSHWELFLSKNLTDWNKVLFDGFDMVNVQKFQNLVKKMNKEDVGNLKELTKEMDLISTFACSINGLERNGYALPGFDNELYLKIWMPEYRKVYDFVTSFNETEYRKNPALRNSFIMCCYAVTHFLLNLCDYGLFSIKKELYLPEVEFLKKSIKITQIIGNIDLNGEVVDLLQIMGEKSPEVLQMINQNHQYLIDEQLDNGGWIGETGEDCSHAVHTAITALLDHDYFWKGTKQFGKMVSYKRWKKRMNMDGLFLKMPDIQTPRDSQIIREQVLAKLKQHGLENIKNS